MGDTSSGRLAFIKETTAGVTPATPAFKLLDFSSEDFVLNKSTTRSAAVTPQRVVRQSRATSRDVGGGPTFELYSGDEIDDLLEALMGNAWATDVSKLGGSAISSFTWERDLGTGDFRRFTGWKPSSAEFTIAAEAIITCRMTGVGYSMTTGTTAITGATYADAATTEKLTALDVVAITVSNGLTGSFDFDQCNFTINNQLSPSKRIGPNSVRRVKAGQALVTGQLRVFVDDKTFADAFNTDGTTFDFDVPMVFGGLGYNAGFKNVSITGYNDPNTGNNNDFMGTIDFEATLDTTFASSFAFTRIAP